MSVLRSLFTTGVLACCFMFFALPASAQVSAPADAPYKVELQRNPDEACTRCHKPQDLGMHGEHAKAINPNSGTPVTCTNCHGNPGPHHREGVKDVMRFNEPAYTASQQNSVCMACHLPEKLQAAFWPHDVHLDKVACASCHTLHPATDPMQKLSDKGRIKICVDCHREQRDNPAFNPSSVKILKDIP